MILKMTRARILGPREKHLEVVGVLQDLNLVHLSSAAQGPHLFPLVSTPAEDRRSRDLRRILTDIEALLKALPGPPTRAPRAGPPPDARTLALWARRARRARRELDRLAQRATALQEERVLVLKYRAYISAFQALVESQARWPNAVAYHVVLRPGSASVLRDLRQSLTSLLEDEFELRARPLPGGETVFLLLVPSREAARIERILAEARVQEIPVPAAYGGATLAEAIPKMLERLQAIPGELADIARERTRLLDQGSAEWQAARSAIRDRLSQIEALSLSSVTSHAFVIEGWLPAGALPELRSALAGRCGDVVSVEDLAREEWALERTPVVLSNPPLIRPFEVLISTLPLPRYGSIDPTPFLAAFFPMFFGLMVGDVAYGLLLGTVAAILRLRSRAGSLSRSVAEVAGACGVFTVLFGFLYGEFLGDLGRRLFGMRPLLLNREEAVLPFLGLAVAIGMVHVVLGLCLGAANAMRRLPRLALGRGLAALMVVLIVLAILAAAEVLPRAFFSPSIMALFVALPILVIAEGLLAPLELLATLGNILSYARVMALGTASVMLAVVANRMIGAFGSVLVGTLLALSFHMVNFAIGLFGPTIHALRLHYVEFFGKFYSPGGVPYRPFGHWSPRPTSNP